MTKANHAHVALVGYAFEPLTKLNAQPAQVQGTLVGLANMSFSCRVGTGLSLSAASQLNHGGYHSAARFGDLQQSPRPAAHRNVMGCKQIGNWPG